MSNMSTYFLPARLLQITITSITPYANWTGGNMGAGDPWVGQPYQWSVVLSITPHQHSSQLTTTPFYYNGNDVVVGDWYADITQGLAVKIVSITSQNPGSVTAIVEDTDRFNTFSDPTGNGNGIGGTGNGFLFTLNDESIPIFAGLTPLQYTFINNLVFAQDQIARFQYRNYLKTFYRVYQANSAFSVGDILVLGTSSNSAIYSTVSIGTSAVKAITGQVNSAGAPGPGWFTYRPVGRVVTGLSPALPGLAGDLIYLSANGLTNASNVATHYSNVAPTTWSTPIYIQLEASTCGIALSRGVDTAGSTGYATTTYVVGNSAAAGALSLNPGDQVMINNTGLGEWGHYVNISNATVLREISTQDSVRVDAESLEVTIIANTVLTNVTVNSQNMTAVFMGNVSASRAIQVVNVQVNQAFSANAVITVGTNSVVDVIMPNALIDLTMLGAYSYQPTVEFSTGYTAIYAFVNFNGTTTGNAVITVTYV